MMLESLYTDHECNRVRQTNRTTRVRTDLGFASEMYWNGESWGKHYFWSLL